jgi:hypothetical protein
MPSAFVKAVPRQSLIDAAKNNLASARARAEARARELGLGDSAVASAGDEAVAEAEAALAVALLLVDEPSAQLERERDVLRAWSAAEAAGELRLPPDSLLVVPRLLEDTGSSRELVLVMEALLRRASPLSRWSTLCHWTTASRSCARSPTFTVR